MRDNVRANRRRVGGNVRRLRLLRGFTQARLAELAGNSDKHVGQVERGEVNVGLDVLTRLASALAVDLADLLGQPPRRVRAEAELHFITRQQIDAVDHVMAQVRGTRRKS